MSTDTLTQGFELNIGGVTLYPQVWQAILIVILLFFLVLVVAQMRHHLMEYSFRGAWFGILLGFVLAVVLEGFLLLSGHTFVTSVLGWKNPPKPLQSMLDGGNKKLRETLGVSTEPCTDTSTTKK